MFVFVEAGQAFGMVFFKKGRLDFLIRYQDFPLLVGHFGEAAAVDDREILADETALLMGRQGENLEAQLLGDEEDRTEDVVARRLPKGLSAMTTRVLYLARRRWQRFSDK